jgi:hypothetical protein
MAASRVRLTLRRRTTAARSRLRLRSSCSDGGRAGRTAAQWEGDPAVLRGGNETAPVSEGRSAPRLEACWPPAGGHKGPSGTCPGRARGNSRLSLGVLPGNCRMLRGPAGSTSLRMGRRPGNPNAMRSDLPSHVTSVRTTIKATKPSVRRRGTCVKLPCGPATRPSLVDPLAGYVDVGVVVPSSSGRATERWRFH